MISICNQELAVVLAQALDKQRDIALCACGGRCSATLSMLSLAMLRMLICTGRGAKAKINALSQLACSPQATADREGARRCIRSSWTTRPTGRACPGAAGVARAQFHWMRWSDETTDLPAAVRSQSFSPVHDSTAYRHCAARGLAHAETALRVCAARAGRCPAAPQAHLSNFVNATITFADTAYMPKETFSALILQQN